MAYSNLSMGSTGDSVKKLQEALNNAGYSLDTDGVFGAKTKAAVQDYQSKNGLAVDGIAGTNTQSSLYGNAGTAANTQTATQKTVQSITPTTSSGLNGVSKDTSDNLAKYEAGYTPSDTVLAAQEYLKSIQEKKPGDYSSSWTEQLNSLYDKIMNRPAFSWDMGNDATYKQYEEKYRQLGQQAMIDTQGQAAALTGGYGSSYGQSVGQQQYQAYLQQLNDIVPELEQNAYSRYQAEGDNMLNQYELTQQRDESDYGRYTDKLNQYNTELSSALGQYDSERSFDYNQYAAMLSYYQQKAQQENSDYWNAAQLAYQRERDAVEDEQWQKEYDLSASKAVSSSGAEAGSTKTSLNTAYKSDNGSQKGGVKSTQGNATSLDYSADEGVFYWNGKSYGRINQLLNDIESANLSESELAELKKKFSAYGFTLS